MSEQIQTLEKVDPMVADIAKKVGMSIEQIVEPESIVTPIEEGMPVLIPDAVGSTPVKLITQETVVDPAKPTVAPAPGPSPAENQPAAPATPTTVVKVVKRETPVVVPQPAKLAEPTEQEKLEQARIKAREEYIATLTPEQQEEIEIATFAESKGKTGMVDGLVDYYRKMDKYIEEHQDQNEESEEFIKFCKDNRPKMSDAERRKFERDMIIDEATRKAREEAERSIEPERRKLRQMEVQPKIEAAVKDSLTAITVADEKNKDRQVFDKELVQSVIAGDYAGATTRNPIEAKIAISHAKAIRSCVGIFSGSEDLDANNPVHEWLLNFIVLKSNEMIQQPVEARIVNGRTFVPYNDYQRIAAQSPQELGKYWTFTTDDIVGMISQNAVDVYNQQLSEMKAAGFERKPAQSAPIKQTETPAPALEIKSPKTTITPMGGAAEPAKNGDAVVQFLPNLKGIVDRMKSAT